MYKKYLCLTVLLLICTPAVAVEHIVAGARVHLRSTPNFRGSSNIIRTLTEGTRLIATQEFDNYLEVTVVPDGTKGYIWKEYVELFNTHDYYKSTSAAFPTVTPDTVDPNISTSDAFALPICGCSGCRKSSSFGIRTHPITGRRRLHAGCDMAAPRGTNVYAVADGKVKRAGVIGGYGKTIDIEHLSMLKGVNGSVISNRGYTTRYAHLWKIFVSPNQRVKRGDRIGQVDSTGLSTGHHLHFEIAVTGTTINPERVFNVADINKSCSQTQGTGGTPTTR